MEKYGKHRYCYLSTGMHTYKWRKLRALEIRDDIKYGISLDLASLTLKMGAIFKYVRGIVVERKLATVLSFLHSLYFQ